MSPAINFRAEFATLVESGKKRQTIRAPREDGRNPQPGQTLYLYVGLRTKGCRKLGEARCLGVTQILIAWDGICLAGTWLTAEEGAMVARNDGFESFEKMAAWFERQHGLPFDGLMITCGGL